VYNIVSTSPAGKYDCGLHKQLWSGNNHCDVGIGTIGLAVSSVIQLFHHQPSLSFRWCRDPQVDKVPDQPDSVPPIPPPVTAYISSKSSATSPASTQKAPALEDDGNTYPPLVRDSSSQTLEDTLPTPTGPSGRRPSISHVKLDNQVRRSPSQTPCPPRQNGPGSGSPRS
jgi:hypothetical protein